MTAMTRTQHEASLRSPAFCELLPVRDFLDGVMVCTNGAYVAGYELEGLHSYYDSEAQRLHIKSLLEALLRNLPELAMRLQVRFEITQGVGDQLVRYNQAQQNPNPNVQALDRIRTEAWRCKDEDGIYLHHHLHAYFIWDPRKRPAVETTSLWPVLSRTGGWSLSADKCIQRTQAEHEALLSEFNSLLAGLESALLAAGSDIRRLWEDEIFLEIKRALNPLTPDLVPYKPYAHVLSYKSARSQIANVSIEEEGDDFLKINGLLYSWLSLKDLPDATFPGILRELMIQDFPLVVSAEFTIPEQSKVVRSYKSRLRKMQAAQRDINGGYRFNVDAHIAEGQLARILEEVISSSLKTCQVSLQIGVRTSKPATNDREYQEARHTLAARRQKVLHAVARMAGARAMTETLAKKRVFIGTLPGMAEANKREHDCLTLNGADLLPLEVPWPGTLTAPLMLVETPFRQLIPFSMFDSSLGDANLLIMAKTGGGKTFMAQQFLLMAARSNPRISIIERGSSYQPLVELMEGRVIEMNLEASETINPWDLEPGEKAPGKEKVAFLKNLTRFMIGDSGQSDSELLDNVISEGIHRTYKRVSIRHSNPTPTFSDLRDELAQWRDEEKLQRTIDEAHLAAIKLRSWTGEKGVYAKLFDRHTTARLDNNWLYFNIEGLSNDSRLETAMSLLIANAMSERSSGKTGQTSIVVLDEAWALLDSQILAPQVVELFRCARKRRASVWGISQTPEDFVGTPLAPRPHGPAILKNVTTKLIGQQPGDMSALVTHLHLNEVCLNQVKQFNPPRKGQSAEALLVIGEKAETTEVIRLAPTPVDYWVCTTFARERLYRNWFLRRHAGEPLLELYKDLARKFPQGLADLPPLPEELSGEVSSIGDCRLRIAEATSIPH